MARKKSLTKPLSSILAQNRSHFQKAFEGRGELDFFITTLRGDFGSGT